MWCSALNKYLGEDGIDVHFKLSSRWECLLRGLAPQLPAPPAVASGPCSPLPRVNAAGATAPPSPRGWNLPEPWEQSYSEGLLLLGDKKTPCRSLGLTASSPTGLWWVNFAPEKGPRQLVEEIGIEDRNNGRHHPVSYLVKVVSEQNSRERPRIPREDSGQEKRQG